MANEYKVNQLHVEAVVSYIPLARVHALQVEVVRSISGTAISTWTPKAIIVMGG